MAQRIFVKVMGFSDVERHALNTIFRLSEQRETIYSLWEADAPETPKLALVDGHSDAARAELDKPTLGDIKIMWVGAIAPANTFRTFNRPLSWPDILKAMDELFAPADPLDFDLGFDDGTSPAVLSDSPPGRRALIAAAGRDERLYLRAKLALAHLPFADEAETGAEALELARTNHYEIALIDFSLADIDGWVLVRQLTGAPQPIRHVIVTKLDPSLGERVRAHFAGIGFFNKPPHPGRLQSLLQKMA